MSEIYPSTDLIERVRKADELAIEAVKRAEKGGLDLSAPDHIVFLIEYLERDGLKVVRETR